MRTMDNLARLRGEIDRIDDRILELVEERLSLCRRIALSKGNGGQLKLSPERQRAVLARLQVRASEMAAPAIPHIWREIMAHGLQVQEPIRFLSPERADRDQLLRLVRERYGSAAPVEWVSCTNNALAGAQSGGAVAVLPATAPQSWPEGLSAFDELREGGLLVGRLVGRVAAEAVSPRLPGWTPASWRTREACQQPHYPDPAELDRVERRLAARAPLVELQDIDGLKLRLAAAAQGQALLLQGGDCVETFGEYSAEKVRATASLLLELGEVMGSAVGHPVVHVGRMAGQFAKPRSSPSEVVDGVALAVYRGDGVNGSEPDPGARTADPGRLIRAHDQSAATLRELWHRAPPGSEPIYASHEALLLNVEQALTRYDELTGRWWSGSGHMLWIGDRTRQLDGAHVEYARGIANPIGLKCGPSLDSDELLRLIDRLDPDNDPGRLTLIPRMGRGRIAERLPQLLRATRREGRNLLWCVDPMHGNTRIVDGRKTRLLDDIMAETIAFHDIAQAEGIWPGGVHLELTGTEVLECIGGRRKLFRPGSKPRYLSGCDPRLNPGQARELAERIASWHSPSAARLRMCG